MTIFGSSWPNVSMEELNMDWIFKVLIPEVQALKTAYDNIQDTVARITQENYTAWRGELQTEMARLQVQINQSNENWRTQFAAQNAAWQAGVSSNLDTRFNQWATGTEASIESWEHDAYSRLTELINSFAADITAAENRAKEYALDLNDQQRAYIQQQVHALNDEILALQRQLQAEVENLNAAIALLRQELSQHKQDVNAEISEFEDSITAQFRQHKESVAASLASMKSYIDEQVSLLNQRISQLTAADIDAIDPITGETENIQFVLRHLFDFFSDDRGPLTAAEYQQLGLTAQEYADHHYKAIIYDCFGWYLLKVANWIAPAISYAGEYVRPEELEQRIKDFITEQQVSAELADYATTNDVAAALVKYAKTSDMQSYIATALENTPTFDDVKTSLSGYTTLEQYGALQTEVATKASQQQLESLRNDIYQELDGYALKSELPDFDTFLTETEALATFPTKEEVAEQFHNFNEIWSELINPLARTVNGHDVKINNLEMDMLTLINANKTQEEEIAALDSAIQNIQTVNTIALPFNETTTSQGRLYNVTIDGWRLVNEHIKIRTSGLPIYIRQRANGEIIDAYLPQGAGTPVAFIQPTIPAFSSVQLGFLMPAFRLVFADVLPTPASDNLVINLGIIGECLDVVTVNNVVLKLFFTKDSRDVSLTYIVDGRFETSEQATTKIILYSTQNLTRTVEV